ncbi:MAG: hypothetical protein ACOYK1_01940 [Vampirovibrionia bacterium]
MPTAHGSSYAHAHASTHLDSLGDPQRDSRGAGEALSRIVKDMPFMAPLRQPLALFIRQLHFPILKPFETLDFVTNHMFSQLAPGFADKTYALLYKVLPTGLISKLTDKIGGGGGGVSKLLIAGLGKVGINTNDDNIKALINELGKGLGDIYNPKFLNQFGNFFTDALRNGNVAYLELADRLTTRALDNVGETVAQALSAIGGTAQAAVAGAIKDTPQKTATNIQNGADVATEKIKNTQKAIHTQKQADSKQVLEKGQPITSPATQNLPTKTPTQGKKTQSPNNNPKPGLFSNLLTSGSNILKNITGIFSPKPTPAAA